MHHLADELLRVVSGWASQPASSSCRLLVLSLLLLLYSRPPLPPPQCTHANCCPNIYTFVQPGESVCLNFAIGTCVFVTASRQMCVCVRVCVQSCV